MVVRGLGYILVVLLFWGPVHIHGWDGLAGGAGSRPGTVSNGSAAWQAWSLSTSVPTTCS